MLQSRSAPQLRVLHSDKNILEALAGQNVMDSGGTETNEEWAGLWTYSGGK